MGRLETRHREIASMKWKPMFYVESGDLFSFNTGSDGQDAAKNFVAKILGIRGATFGEMIVVKTDYRGKTLARFTTESIFSLWPGLVDMKFEKKEGRIHIKKSCISRSSRFVDWQRVFRKGEPMMRIKKCHWIAKGITKNPITGVMA